MAQFVSPGFDIGTTAEVGDTRLDPSTKSSDYIAMEPYWLLVDSIMGGKETMNIASEKYLVRYPEEQVTNDSQGNRVDPYATRLQSTPFTNIFKDIVLSLASKPFSEELKLKADAPEQYQKLAENVDAQGHTLHVFGSEVFKDALAHAISWIVVDFSKPAPRLDGQPLSKADEQAQGLRPYFCWVPARQMFGVYSAMENGREIITHARIFEPSVTLDGYLEIAVERVRVMWREPIEFDAAGNPSKWGKALYALWERLVPSETNPTGLWQIIDSGEYSIGYLPVVPVYLGTRKFTGYQIDPPLVDLANMQIAEYNQESNLDNIIVNTCFPMYAMIGVKKPEEGNLPVGPRAVHYIEPSDAGNGDMKAIEPQGASVRVVMDKLKDTRTEMRDLGFQPLVQQNLTVITTGQVAVKANSQVQAWALLFKDAMEQAWQITADWLGDAAYEPEVEIYLDYSAAVDQGTGWTALQFLRTNGDVSRETVLAGAERYGYLPQNFDIEKDAEQLATEQASLQPEVPIDPRTGQPLQNTGNVVAMSARRQGNGAQPPANTPPQGAA